MAKKPVKTKPHYVVLPSTNVWNVDSPGTAVTFMKTASRTLRNATGKPTAVPLTKSANLKVLDQVAPEDTMLVAMSDEQLLELSMVQPGLRIEPVVEVSPLWLRKFELSPLIAPAGKAKKVQFPVTVVADDTGKPFKGVEVYGFTDRANQTGAMNVTNKDGEAILVIPGGLKLLEVVEVVEVDGYWPAYAKNVKVTSNGLELRCKPIDLGADEVRDHFDLRGAPTDGAGVVVGVIDTGANAHKDLVIAKGRNLVAGEDPAKFNDLLGHGSHVCGIIAGRAAAGTGARGVAPGVTLHVYKVFGKGKKTAESFHIAKAIRAAVDDGCDLLNLSLGADKDMPEVLREIQRARALGVVCLGATGNDYRAPVGYPARYSQVVAVSAMGRKGTYPKGASEELSAMPPYGADKKNYVADFSNVGPEVSLIGPGVGIVSTFKKGYAVMDGTSMACPVATGALARLLSKNKKILAMDRDQNRSDAIIRLALSNAKALGFGAKFEGAGLLV